jgi:hypothetical protein
MIVLNNLLVVGALNAIKEKGFQALERRRVAVRTLLAVTRFGVCSLVVSIFIFVSFPPMLFNSPNPSEIEE